jgi:hypothetical protein
MMAQAGPFPVQWQSWAGQPNDLLAGATLDFSAYSSWSFVPQGPYQSLGNVTADGVAVDNLSNSNPVTINVGQLTETVPPYSKSTITLPPGRQVTLTAVGGYTVVMFFKGAFHGSSSVTNFYDAQRQANLSTLNSGTVDAWFNTVYAAEGFALPSGTDLNLLTNKTGLFDVVAPLNGPSGVGISTTNWFIWNQVYSQSPSYIFQRAISVTQTGLVFDRFCNNGTWSAWFQLAYTNYLSPSVGLVKLSENDLTGVSALIVTLSSSYKAIEFNFRNLQSTTAASGILATWSYDGGVTYSTGADYARGVYGVSSASASLFGGAGGLGSVNLLGSADVNTPFWANGIFTYPDASISLPAQITSHGKWTATSVFWATAQGYRVGSGLPTHLKFAAAAGVWSQGKASIYGRV